MIKKRRKRVILSRPECPVQTPSERKTLIYSSVNPHSRTAIRVGRRAFGIGLSGGAGGVCPGGSEFGRNIQKPSITLHQSLSSLPVPHDTLLHLAGMLGLPRGGGVSYSKRWSRLQSKRREDGKTIKIHRPIGKKEFVKRLSDGKATAVSFLPLTTDTNNGTYQYGDTVRCFVLDHDMKKEVPDDRKEEVRRKIWDAVEYLHNNILLMGLIPGLTHSGSKGYHQWLFWDKEIHQGYAAGFFRDVMVGCPHFEPNGSLWVLRGDDGKTVWAEIDSLFKTGDGGIIKVPFSQHQSREGYFELPISISDLRSYTPMENPSDDVFREAESVFKGWKINPAEYAICSFPKMNTLNKGGRPKARVYRTGASAQLPTDVKGYERELELIKSWYDPQSPTYLPCFAKSVDLSKPPKISRYNQRTVVSRMIVNRLEELYDVDRDRGKKVAALFIRTEINDAEDNSHPETMDYQTHYWNDNHSSIVNNCEFLMNTDWTIHCCDQPCGRLTPLHQFPSGDRAEVLNIPPLSPLSMKENLKVGRKKRRNQQYFKATRAGGTSTITADCMDHHERITIVVPTTRIAETIEEALRLSKFGDKKLAALLASNLEGCLKLKEFAEENSDLFENQRNALKENPVHFKFNCKNCKYNNSFLPVEPGTVLHKSDLTNRKCLHTTIMYNLQKFHILVITHKKLHALKMASTTPGENRHMDDSVVDSELLLGWISNSDVILLDEISMMIDQPDLEVPIWTVSVDDDEVEFDIIKETEKEFGWLEQFRTDSLTAEVRTILNSLKKEFQDAKAKDPTLEVWHRDKTEEEDTQIVKYLKRLQTFAIRENKSLKWLFNVIMAFQEKQWVLLQVPDMDLKKNLRIYTLPKFTEGVANVIAGSYARIIAMDATHPLAAATHLHELVDREFDRINIGDPQDSAALQRIISWPGTVKSPNITHNFEDDSTVSDTCAEIRDAIIMMNKLWGKDKFVVAVPSKRIAKIIRSVLPGDLQDIDIMWHRGSDSVGVKNDKRIMLGISAPYAPKNSQNWIKEVLYPDQLERVSKEELWEYDKSKTDIQTMSRVKDPCFEEEKRRSVYVALGQPANELEAMRRVCVCPPDMIRTPIMKLIYNRYFIPIVTAYYWTEYGIELSTEEQLALYHYHHRLPTESSRDVYRRLDDPQMGMDNFIHLISSREYLNVC